MNVLTEGQRRLLGPTGDAFLVELIRELSFGVRGGYQGPYGGLDAIDQWYRCHIELVIMISEQLLVILGAHQDGSPTERFMEDLRTKARIYGTGCEQRLLSAIEWALRRPYESASAAPP